MDFLSSSSSFSRKLLSDDKDLKKLCNDCLDYLSDSCSSDCIEKCRNLCHISIQSLPPPSKSPHKLSNLVTSTIAFLSFTFLLILCYAIYARFYSGRRRRIRHPDAPPPPTHDQHDFLDEDQGPVLDHPIWYIRTIGLPQAVIDSIAVCKFKSGEGLIDGTECSVCLSEFEEDETLRLLPKCSHAFHLPCIDTWLRSHTNCPMCRAPVVAQPTSAASPPSPPPPAETQIGDLQREEGDGVNLGESSTRNEEQEEEEEEIHFPDEEDSERISSDIQPVRRSVSLDSLSALRISSVFANVNEKQDTEAESIQRNGNGWKKSLQGRGNSSSAMNRSVSCSGKFLMRSSTQRSNETYHS